MKGMRTSVLVADDHPLYRSGIVSAFSHAESRFAVVGEAGSGTEAVAALLRLRPALAILDLQMPGSDGIAAFAQARALDPALPTRALLLTGDLTDAVHERALRAGFTAALPKDLSRLEVLRAATSALSLQRVAA